jgi:hypothetical protein
MKDHIVQTDDNEYEITVHPAFASRCTIGGTDGGAQRELYKQSGVHTLNGKGVPEKHTIRLKGKNGSKRDITITLTDPSHNVARITVELYEESHNPLTAKVVTGTDTVFSVENYAKLCPPNCGEET